MSWNEFHFLHALGWAILNNFWQMALLWCLYLFISNTFKIPAHQTYLIAVFSVFLGLVWFLFSLFSFYGQAHSLSESWNPSRFYNSEIVEGILSAASLLYLLFLMIPTYKLFRNWGFLQAVRKKGRTKAPVEIRLFVAKMAAQLGIRKKVWVHLSQLVNSPVTIGYLKPVILIPIAALTHLSPLQLEAVLLHELSHIKRHDYFINLFLKLTQAMLYFNPFIKLFMNVVEGTRETCCDDVVLQFEYDQLSYASALLQLEKTNHFSTGFAMGAAYKSHLMYRVEKILGINRKARFGANYVVGIFASGLLFLMLHTLITTKKSKALQHHAPVVFTTWQMHFNLTHRSFSVPFIQQKANAKNVKLAVTAHKKEKETAAPLFNISIPASGRLPETENENFKTAAIHDAKLLLTPQQQALIKQTLSKTKELMRLNLNEVALSVPDGITSSEKEAMKKNYLYDVERINWKQLEHNMEAGYDEINLENVNLAIDLQLTKARLDSVITVCQTMLASLQKIKSGEDPLPLPDVSMQQIIKAKEELQRRIVEMKNIRDGKITKL